MECREAKLIYDFEFWISCIPLSLIVLVAILYLWLSNYQLTVTDKRVYGKAAFGKRVDLPFDSISAVGTSWLKGIDVGTSSGRIRFKLVKNQDEIHSVMGNLLLERQQKESPKSNISTTPITSSNADELKKFKDLLDGGVITQEEFDEKKRQLLGL
ncbi:MAG: SHOCT domain-containing protein [Ruminococcaceae bacterium]|nr:SHOCT domain-containing protein [Oscillospiraceae bacterium]